MFQEPPSAINAYITSREKVPGESVIVRIVDQSNILLRRVVQILVAQILPATNSAEFGHTGSLDGQECKGTPN
jgi:hypothetical protein